MEKDAVLKSIAARSGFEWTEPSPYSNSYCAICNSYRTAPSPYSTSYCTAPASVDLSVPTVTAPAPYTDAALESTEPIQPIVSQVLSCSTSSQKNTSEAIVDCTDGSPTNVSLSANGSSDAIVVCTTGNSALLAEQVHTCSENGALSVLLQQVLLSISGFKVATPQECNAFNRQLEKISPSKTTALYDSFAMGVKHMLQLRMVVEQLFEDVDFTFLHVVLTDGMDTSSSTNLNTAAQLCHQLSGLGGQCRTVFIGVELDAKARSNLEFLASAGGENISMELCSQDSIGQILDKIEVSIGIQERLHILQAGEATLAVQETGLHLQLKERKYALWFNLDISGSMSGQRWRNTKVAVQKLLAKLTPEDMFGAAVFNDEVQVITE